MGTEIPERFRRAPPAWTKDPPIIPPKNPAKPFDDPPRPTLELDPPERNPYNDLDYSPFIVTDNPSARTGDGLLGMLLRAMMQQNQIQPDAESSFALDAAEVYAALPREFATAPQKPVRILARRTIF